MSGYPSLNDLFRPSQDFTERRFADQQTYTWVMFMVFAPFAMALWGWDVAIDSIGARDTWPYRLVMGLTAAIPALLLGSRRISTSAKFWLIAITSLLVIGEFYVICAHLKDGFVYGIGGFMFMQVAGFLLWTGLPFAWTIGIHVAGAALPQLLALLLRQADFPQLQFAVLLWPATGLSLVAHYAMYSDYLRKVELRRRLVELASTDPLTGLLNRRTFMRAATDLMAPCAREGQPITLMFIDADHFKRINDHHGHSAGDAVLVQLGEVIRAQLRKQDLCCRWGGEEFVALFARSDEQTARRIADRTLSAIREARVAVEGHAPLQFTASIGMSSAAAASIDLDGLIHAADEAMYAAKASGRDRVCVSPVDGSR